MATPETFKTTRKELSQIVRSAENTLEYSLARMATCKSTLGRMHSGVGNPTLESVCAVAETLGFKIAFEKFRP